MRRFAAVFSNKRSDRNGKQDDSTHNIKRARSQDPRQALPVLPASPSTPVLTVLSHPSASSTSSASCSTSIRTPDDVPSAPSTLSRTSTKKSWISWLGRRKSSTVKALREPDRSSVPSNWDPPPLPKLFPPSGGSLPILSHANDSEDETSDEEEEDEDDDYDDDHNERPKPMTPAATPSSLAQSRQFLSLFTTMSLSPLPSSTPFYHHSGSPPFPRSANQAPLPPPSSDLRINMFRTHLLRQLQAPNSQQGHEILSFASRTLPIVAEHPPVNPTDELAIARPNNVLLVSHGLMRWMSRPAFEDRYVVWYPKDDSPGQLQRRAVPGTRFAVLDLEFSVALEALAGADDVLDLGNSLSANPSRTISLPDFDDFELSSLSAIGSLPESLLPGLAAPVVPELEKPDVPILPELSNIDTPAKVTKTEPLAQSTTQDDSSLSVPGRNAYKATPSPLRMQHVPPSLQGSPAPTHSAQLPASSEPPATKRGVRFAEEEKDDTIPIGYVLRLKKKKAEKARFLAEEQARRAQTQTQLAREKEAAKLDAERCKREAERNEWEKERRAWEREKKAMEEERSARKYAEEVAATRQRREAGRAGNIPGTGFGVASSGIWPPSSTSTPNSSIRSRDSRRMSRPANDVMQQSQSLAQVPTYHSFQGDARRQMSAPAPSSNTNSTSSPLNGSPSSSRPPSGETPMSTPPNGSPLLSRPASLYSSNSPSAEDVRMGHSKRASRAGSAHGSVHGSPSLVAMQMPYGWTYGPGYFVPPVPALPVYAMDIPLLPPSPAFMTQQYPRPRSRESSSGNSSSSRTRLPNTGSDENLAQKRRSQVRQSSAPVVGRSDSPGSRRGSTDMTRARDSNTNLSDRGRHPASGSNSGHSSASNSRSRPVSHTSLRGVPTQMQLGSVYLQEPSPWTAPPTSAQMGMGYGSSGSLTGSGGGNPRPSSMSARASSRRQTAIS